jgi:hypothetical protein
VQLLRTAPAMRLETFSDNSAANGLAGAAVDDLVDGVVQGTTHSDAYRFSPGTRTDIVSCYGVINNLLEENISRGLRNGIDLIVRGYVLVLLGDADSHRR